MISQSSSITRWLQKTSAFWFALYAAGAAFSLYTCVYAFRKAFAVATFEGEEFLNISLKVWLIFAQVIGYALSKFIGIKVISELKPNRRSSGILLMMTVAGLSLILFALVPTPYNIIFLFTNGLPLGMIWGMIFHYLEGRRTSEVLGAGLSVSFIFSTGFVKSVGAYIMLQWGTSSYWMPALTALVFTPPLIFFLWMLEQLPPPSAEDEAARTKRQPMNAQKRKNFLVTFAPGLVLLILSYMLLTAFRDFRDNFSAELWASLGYADSPGIFTITEIPISIIVLVVMGSVMFIKSNRLALIVNHYLVIAGLALVGLSSLLFQLQWIGAPLWMVMIGLGLYMGYVPFNSIFFERLIAAFQYTGTVGFVMYLADSFGYLGSVMILFYKEFGFKEVSWINFFLQSGYVISLGGSALMIASLAYFQWRHHTWKYPYRPAMEVRA